MEWMMSRKQRLPTVPPDYIHASIGDSNAEEQDRVLSPRYTKEAEVLAAKDLPSQERENILVEISAHEFLPEAAHTAPLRSNDPSSQSPSFSVKTLPDEWVGTLREKAQWEFWWETEDRAYCGGKRPANRSQEVIPRAVHLRSLWRGYGGQPPAEVGGQYWIRTSDLRDVNATL